MGIEAFTTLFIIALIIGLLIFSGVSTDIILFGGLTILMVVPVPTESGWKIGILTASEALAGLANPAPVAVGVLFIVAAGVKETGALEWVGRRVLGMPSTMLGAQLRVMSPVILMSAFLNNTPVVAMLIPLVNDWTKKLRISSSKLMMPLSFAAILGGMCTLIGTSTNLVVNGLVVAHTNLKPLSMFDLTWVGLPCAIVGAAFMAFIGQRLLPERKSAISTLQNPREYTIEMIIEPSSPLIGKTIAEAGLRHLPGAYLIEIDRRGIILQAVGPDEPLEADDRLVFAGIVESVKDLQKIRGLKPATDQVFKLNAQKSHRGLVEAVVSDACPLAGKTIREGRFRSTYNAAVIAVARNGARIQSKIGDIVLSAGDTLLLAAPPGFVNQQRNSRDFFLVSAVEDSAPVRYEKAWLAMLILLAMVVLAATELLPILTAAMLAAGLMVICRCCSTQAARRSIDWQVLMVIAAALGFGRAMEKTGAASFLAEMLLTALGRGPRLTLAAVYCATSVLSALITPAAAAALVFPIAISAAAQFGVNPMPYVIGLTIAAAGSFATPLSYQTNLMVYGPGGYKFSDYLKAGVPLTVIVGITAVALIPLFWPF